MRPNNVALTTEINTSGNPVISVSVVTYAPAETFWIYTPNKKPPTRPMVITAPLSNKATYVEAATRGTTSRWIGSMPSTSSASISSRMVLAPRSAQMAVDPAPATTSTVTIGPSWVTAANPAPAPEA